MRLLGLLVIAVLAAFAGGVGQAGAAPETTPSAPGATPPSLPGGLEVPETGIAQLDTILQQLAGSGSSTPGQTAQDTSQMIVVTAPKASDTTATLTGFERGADGSWKPVVGPTTAYLGELGMGEPQDNVYRTPQGTFALDQAFGRQANPGTKMPYFKTDNKDWWDSNMKSPTYNTHVRQAASPGGDSENLYNTGPMYDYAVNIAHNPQRIPGKASAIFLHVTDKQPTMGCVAIDREDMRKIVTWLDPAKNPKITIGVNQPAPVGNAPAATPEGATPGTTTPGTATPGTTTPAVPGLTEGLGTDAITQLLNQLVGILPAIAAR